ncbi:MAG: hypothetical protein ACK2UC_07310 [Anaerolineae bacterium]|jgi:hypothetical protein
MTGERRSCPWFALLLMADGLTAAIGGRRPYERLRRVAPLSLQVALDGLLELPEFWLRLTGAGEALFGAALLAAWLRQHPKAKPAAASASSTTGRAATQPEPSDDPAPHVKVPGS